MDVSQPQQIGHRTGHSIVLQGMTEGGLPAFVTRIPAQVLACLCTHAACMPSCTAYAAAGCPEAGTANTGEDIVNCRQVTYQQRGHHSVQEAQGQCALEQVMQALGQQISMASRGRNIVSLRCLAGHVDTGSSPALAALCAVASQACGLIGQQEDLCQRNLPDGVLGRQCCTAGVCSTHERSGQSPQHT